LRWQKKVVQVWEYVKAHSSVSGFAQGFVVQLGMAWGNLAVFAPVKYENRLSDKLQVVDWVVIQEGFGPWRFNIGAQWRWEVFGLFALPKGFQGLFAQRQYLLLLRGRQCRMQAFQAEVSPGFCRGCH
jgi:hypothetical protein